MTPLASGPEPTTSPVVLDGGDRGCVRLLLELRALVADVAPGTVIHLRTTDPAAPLDLPAWCHLTGHGYLGPIPHDGAPTYGVRTHRVAGVGTDPDNPWRPARPR
ncbi:sulfurtransferase TusA family protein [Micromonospora coxensis]|uniref:sulfurtransferase TusA family protein n=1 Tax=Micromonospora coxensis TaxID=356852 RepID=UPI00344A1655